MLRGEDMSRDYQAKKNKYWIPHNQYMQTLYFIRSYDELIEMHDDIIEEMKSVSDLDGMPHADNITDSTALKASKVEQYKDDILIIENAIATLPEDYQLPVWKNVMYRERWPDTMSVRHWSKWKYKFVHKVAVDKKIIV